MPIKFTLIPQASEALALPPSLAPVDLVAVLLIMISDLSLLEVFGIRPLFPRKMSDVFPRLVREMLVLVSQGGKRKP